MAIAGYSPTKSFEPAPELPVAVSNNFKGTVYDNNQVPVTSLLSYVEGTPWELEDYFRAVLGAHNDIKELDPGLSQEFQSYSLIKNLEVRLDDELSSSTDQTSHMTRVTGSALVYGFIKPNVNDYFIAKTGYNRSMLFRITEVDRLTWRRESVMRIQFTSVDYTDRVQTDVENLHNKVTSKYFFDRERLMEGLAPYLKEEDYKLVTDLRRARERIGISFLRDFGNSSAQTLTLPAQTDRVYDKFLTDFVTRTFGYFEFPQMLHIKQLPDTGELYLSQPQFWSAVLEADPDQIRFGNQRMNTVSTKSFFLNSYIKTMYSARMDRIVYPVQPDESIHTVDHEEVKTSLRGTPIATESAPNAAFAAIPRWESATGAIDAYPLISVDDYYVMTEAFYKEDRAAMTLIEIMTWDYLERKTIDAKQLSFMINIYSRMPRLEQFYFGPLLLCLMRFADQQAYS